ncbi:MAG: hypothetical protein ACRD1Z_21140 [Vicinamibacteria bacterium]
MLRRIYADVDPSVQHLAERSLLSGLMKLEEEGRARESEPATRSRPEGRGCPRSRRNRCSASSRCPRAGPRRGR